MRTSQRQSAERREDPRSCLRLKLVVLYPQTEGRPAKPMFHGKTYDLSMSGLSMVVDYNVFQEGEVTVVLALPAAHDGAPRKVVTATAEMTYAIHSSKLDAFKIGLAFRTFRGDGKALLGAALEHAFKDESADAAQDAGARPDSPLPLDSQLRGWW
ncbi:MAG: PilZ domain-containing protein [Burkholderiales bacterium]